MNGSVTLQFSVLNRNKCLTCAFCQLYPWVIIPWFSPLPTCAPDGHLQSVMIPDAV